MMARAAIGATIGRRLQQEDTAYESTIRLPDGREALLVIVADGMGGAVGGEIASRRAVDAFAAHAEASSVATGERLRDALRSANDAIASEVAAEPGLAGMGTTLVGTVVDGEQVDWISVGDSLLLAVEDGGIRRLNADHSVRHRRHLLRSALMGEPIPLIDAGHATVGRQGWLVAASDGLLTLDFAVLADLVAHAATSEEAVRKVVDAVDALRLEHQDNMTVAVVGAAQA